MMSDGFTQNKQGKLHDTTFTIKGITYNYYNTYYTYNINNTYYSYNY